MQSLVTAFAAYSLVLWEYVQEGEEENERVCVDHVADDDGFLVHHYFYHHLLPFRFPELRSWEKKEVEKGRKEGERGKNHQIMTMSRMSPVKSRVESWAVIHKDEEANRASCCTIAVA